MDHPKITFVKPKLIDAVRVKASTRENVQNYTAELHKLFDAKKYKPDLIFNFDESWLNPHKQGKTKLIAMSNSMAHRPILGLSEKEKEHLTVCCTISANGDVLKSQIILPIKNIPDEWFDESITRWNYSFVYGSSGWANQVLYISFYSKL